MTDTWTWLLLVVLIVGTAIVGLSWTAGRLDRLHIRLATARASLDRQLADRVATTMRVAAVEPTDPAAAVLLAGAAEEARTAAASGESEIRQSALSQALRAVLDDSTSAALWRDADDVDRSALRDLANCCERVRLACHFHADLVARTADMRRRRLVRWFRLAGRAPWPEAYVIDDRPPLALLRTTTPPATLDGSGSHP